jgi:hypothetical protein
LECGSGVATRRPTRPDGLNLAQGLSRIETNGLGQHEKFVDADAALSTFEPRDP